MTDFQAKYLYLELSDKLNRGINLDVSDAKVFKNFMRFFTNHKKVNFTKVDTFGEFYDICTKIDKIVKKLR
jgi:hypothetical protein